MAIKVNYQPAFALTGGIAQAIGQGDYRQRADAIRQRQIDRDMAIADAQFRQQQQIQAADRQQIRGQVFNLAGQGVAAQNRLRETAMDNASRERQLALQGQAGLIENRQRIGGQLAMQQLQGFQATAQDARRAEIEQRLSDRKAEQEFLAERGINPSILKQFDSEQRRIDEMVAGQQLSPDEAVEATAQINARREAAIMNSMSSADPWPEGRGVGQMWQATDPQGQPMQVGGIPVMYTRSKDGEIMIPRGYNSILQQAMAASGKAAEKQSETSMNWMDQKGTDKLKIIKDVRDVLSVSDPTTGVDKPPSQAEILQFIRDDLGYEMPEGLIPEPMPVAERNAAIGQISGAAIDFVGRNWGGGPGVQSMFGQAGDRAGSVLDRQTKQAYVPDYPPIVNATPIVLDSSVPPAVRADIGNRVFHKQMKGVPRQINRAVDAANDELRRHVRSANEEADAIKQLNALMRAYGDYDDDRMRADHGPVQDAQVAIRFVKSTLEAFGTDPKTYPPETLKRYLHHMNIVMQILKGADNAVTGRDLSK